MFKCEEVRTGPEELASPGFGKSRWITTKCHVTKTSHKVYVRNHRETVKRQFLGPELPKTEGANHLTPDHPLFTMSDLCSENSEEEHSEVEERPQEQRVTWPPIIQLMPRTRAGSPAGSPKSSPRDSPRGSPRNSPLLFRKLLMNRSINLQRRRFTLAHTPR